MVTTTSFDLKTLQGMTTLFIIDDHPLVGEGISMMIKDVSHLKVVAICSTANEAIEKLKEEMPDVILLDISLPDKDGLELCAEIRKMSKEVKILGLTSTNEAGIISQFLARGGSGYMLKNMDRSELIHAIDEVLRGVYYLSKAANQKLLEQYHSVKDALSRAPLLTRREKEILGLLYEGFNGPAIAEKLFISPYTVETHRKNLLQKFEVSTTQQLLKMAKEGKMI